jgi:hypothetical protein
MLGSKKRTIRNIPDFNLDNVVKVIRGKIWIWKKKGYQFANELVTLFLKILLEEVPDITRTEQ